MAHGKDDDKTDSREKMPSEELAREETMRGNGAQDKITQEEVVNSKVKITLIPEVEEEVPNEVVRRSAMRYANQKCRV